MDFWKDMVNTYKVDMSALIPYAQLCMTKYVDKKNCLPEEIQAHSVKIASIDIKTMKQEDIEPVKVHE